MTDPLAEVIGLQPHDLAAAFHCAATVGRDEALALEDRIDAWVTASGYACDRRAPADREIAEREATRLASLSGDEDLACSTRADLESIAEEDPRSYVEFDTADPPCVERLRTELAEARDAVAHNLEPNDDPGMLRQDIWWARLIELEGSGAVPDSFGELVYALGADPERPERAFDRWRAARAMLARARAHAAAGDHDAASRDGQTAMALVEAWGHAQRADMMRDAVRELLR